MIRLRSFQTRDLAGLHRLDQVCFPREIAYYQGRTAVFPDPSQVFMLDR